MATKNSKVTNSKSVNNGDQSAPFVVGTLSHNRNIEVWCNWDLVELSDGSQKAQCKHCGSLLSKDSNSTLTKHVKKYCKALKEATPGQVQLSKDGTIFHYEHNVTRDRMAKLVIKKALPFGHFDDPNLTNLIRETLQPRYKHVSRRTLKRHCLKLWENARKDLIVCFKNLKTSVNLTSDVWSAPHGLPESYICVTAHWVDPDTWQMMKRTIAFDEFPSPHTGENIYKIINTTIIKYSLEDKIFSISFDNASNNTLAIDKLKLKYKPIVDGAFYHTRCVAHIINLVVQTRLKDKFVSDFIKAFRVMLQDVFKSGKERYQDYKKLCKDVNQKMIGPNWDIPTRWNSTCHMFEMALKQMDTLKTFHTTLSDDYQVDPFPDTAWSNIKTLSTFLKVLKTSTTVISGVYYPTSSRVLSELYLIATNFKNFENSSDMLRNMLKPMIEKFKKYILDLPPVFLCAAALNPILNVPGVEAIIEEIYDKLDMHEEDPTLKDKVKESFNSNLSKLYDHYLKKYGDKNHTNLFKSRSSTSNDETVSDPIITMLNVVRDETVKQQRGSEPSSELGRYKITSYSHTMTSEEYNNFDILSWWKSKESEFPILATMARDILTVQASTVASESVFSLSGRVLSIRRTRLTPESLEMAICLKDHLDAVDRVQDKTSLEDEVELEHNIIDEEEDDSTEVESNDSDEDCTEVPVPKRPASESVAPATTKRSKK
ncbi:putative transcription factor/ chromatin remodeling BED-type(Zn) family [Helianthus debilis subsp. tardiflorus]